MRDAKTDIEALETAMRQLFQAMKRPHRWEQLIARAGVSVDRPAAAILHILAAAGPTGTSVHGLAEALGIEAPSVTRNTQELEEAGFIKRERSQVDKRMVHVYITPRGKKAVGKIRAVQHKEVQAVLAEWSAADRQQLVTLFSRFASDVAKHLN